MLKPPQDIVSYFEKIIKNLIKVELKKALPKNKQQISSNEKRNQIEVNEEKLAKFEENIQNRMNILIKLLQKSKSITKNIIEKEYQKKNIPVKKDTIITDMKRFEKLTNATLYRGKEKGHPYILKIFKEDY